MNPKRKIYAHTIVLLGSFNPKIFHPAWFVAEGLIGKNEIDNPNVQFVHQDMAIFELTWLKMQVMRDKLIAETKQDGFFEMLRDLVVGTLQILNHTPVTAVGINQNIHYELSKGISWPNIVGNFINNNFWNNTLEGAAMEKIVFRKERLDSYPGFQVISLEPSRRISNGLYYSFNDHYEIYQNKNQEIFSSVFAEEIIRENWKNSLASGQTHIQKILENL